MQSSPSPEALSAQQAAAFLGVKPETLYAYASRGLLRRVGTGKRRVDPRGARRAAARP